MKYFVREASSTRKRWQVCYTVLSEDESYDYYNSMISKVIPVTKRGYNKTGIVYGSNSSSSSSSSYSSTFIIGPNYTCEEDAKMACAIRNLMSD